METSVELSVVRLIIDSSIFTKSILISLFIISIISWAIILHKYLYINNYKSNISRFLKSLTSQNSLRYIEESCIQFSKSAVRTMPILLIKIIKSKNQGRSVYSPESIINNAAMHEMNKLQKGMGVLATTASVSPLIGLLGTVWGIIYSFINISQKGNASIDTVAPGIAEALITTLAGLCVAIPALVGHNFLSGTINNCMDYIDRISEYALSLFTKETIE